MECPKCGKEVEAILVKQWETGRYKCTRIALYECPNCTTRFEHGTNGKTEYEKWIDANPKVKEFFDGRPLNTVKCYALQLMKFFEFSKITPEDFVKKDKNQSDVEFRKQLRTIAWSYLSTLKSKPSSFSNAICAIKSFYRYVNDGEILSFDSSRNGKHYVNTRRVARAKYEHVPNKSEVYAIADMSTCLRDRAMILTLFQSGIRVNALVHLNYGHVKDEVKSDRVPIHIRITDDIDTKMRGYGIDFYDTFIAREACEAIDRGWLW